MLIETNVKTTKAILLLYRWLHKASPDSLFWLNSKIEEINNTADKKILFTSYSAVPRYLGKQKLNLSIEELQTARKLVTGWNPVDLTLAQAGRILLLLSFPNEDSDCYSATLEQIIAAADVEEAIAF